MLHYFLLFVAFGLVGLLIEVFFTGTRNVVLKRDWSAEGKTFLVVIPMYSIAASLIYLNHLILPNFQYMLRALIDVVIIFASEFCGGWLCEKIIRFNPWNYGKHWWTPYGYINLTYAGFWYVVALAFDPIARFLWHAVQFF